MRYMGSKGRIAKHILPIILKDRKPDQCYVEPFCGGCNTLDKVTGNRIGADTMPEVIAMFKAMQQGWLPPKYVNEDQYILIRDKSKDLALRGYVGFGFSFGGKFFASQARHERIKGGYASLEKMNKQVYASFIKQVPLLQNVRFYLADYKSLRIPSASIIYCDPPYASTAGYKDKSGFNHNEFYDWCRLQKAKGHTIFISEYYMPKDFKPVLSLAHKVHLNANVKSLPRIEKLFTL